DGIRDFHVTGVQTCALPIFLFSNLPCNRDYVLAATMESLHRVGATPEVVATVGDEDSLTVAPPLIVGPGRHLAGRIVFTDGRQRSEERRVGKVGGARGWRQR